ncbi:L,D-transpeptidase family protein [Streptomyces sp. NPDC006430]|uniref:L,D-transpeptidase family protein n=1 Tax=Streptomyces sp. NPDC006430 TaxID=3154299 RepID=UPI0033AEB1D4
MSQHARARSRFVRRLALVATLGLLIFTAIWIRAVVDEQGVPVAAQASESENRPPVEDRTARAAERDRLQGLPGISDETRSKIPAESRQLILVTGKAQDSSHSTATLYSRPAAGADWRRVAGWPARNGAKGWSTERTQGDLTTPEGVFSLTDAGGLLPKPPGTRLPYSQSPFFVPEGLGVNGESLAGAFDYVVAIDFNRRQGFSPLDDEKPDGEDMGGNIWLHVDHDGPSRGCIGIPKEAMEKILTTLDPAAKPVIAMGPAGF